ncbi:UPF0171 family protein [Heterostelium album PN500]|uniref:UPF0171 family protein n=1 Tax=Heterostelium pallidum (strain ATCC 26659 / Pp 5 / PN500) TaxID=670386 RepID=D3AVT0_HETP5|nr:UPF0171 family protein [Heterostelium album PN500]EFA86403.1 UPF0171 family protein [Heterostelium album PN500]|eukprot:XP_020438508.1 UPF0171 family protein [Heterostelium album PN500]
MAFRQQHPIMTPANNSGGGGGRGGGGGSGGGSLSGSTESDNTKSADAGAPSRAGSYATNDNQYIYNLSSEILTPILTPKPTLCDMSFELMIENTKFIGHPTLLSNDDESDSDGDSGDEQHHQHHQHHNHHQDVVNEDVNNQKLTSSSMSRRFSTSSNKSTGSSHKRSGSQHKCKDGKQHGSSSSNSKNVNSNDKDSSNNSNKDKDSGSSSSTTKEKEKRLESSTNSTSSNSSSGSDELTMFNLLFVMSTNVGELNENRDNSLKRCALKIASALKHEQKRCGYISKQVHEIMLVRDGWLTEHTLDTGDDKPNHQELTDRILKKSQLGMEIKKIYDALNSDRPASLRINNWINLHLNINNPDYYSDYPMRPYHALLINLDHSTLPANTDTSPALQRLLDVAKPTKSFRDLQLETDLPLSYLYRLSSHLVYWGKAKIINMLTKNNVYVLTPPTKITDNNNNNNSSSNNNNSSYIDISNKFNIQFPEFQFQDILLRFSSARPLAEHISKFHQSYHVTFLQIVCWLLQHDLIMQLHTYIHLMITYRQQPTTSPNTPLLYQTPHFPMTPSHLLPHEIAFFERIDDSTKSYLLFKRLVPYFRGQHHLEEIMWRENISREDLNKILKKYKSVLIQVTHEESIVT